MLKDGKVRALGASTASRLPIAPDVPTIAEEGVPGFDVTSWQMIVAPAGTPPEIVDKLHVELKKVLELPDVKAEFARTARITVDHPSVDDSAALHEVRDRPLGQGGGARPASLRSELGRAPRT